LMRVKERRQCLLLKMDGDGNDLGERTSSTDYREHWQEKLIHMALSPRYTGQVLSAVGTGGKDSLSCQILRAAVLDGQEKAAAVPVRLVPQEEAAELKRSEQRSKKNAPYKNFGGRHGKGQNEREFRPIEKKNNESDRNPPQQRDHTKANATPNAVKGRRNEKEGIGLSGNISESGSRHRR